MPEPVPCRILIGPFSPMIHQAGMLLTSSLTNPLYLGEYLRHPQIRPFYMHPQTMVSRNSPSGPPELEPGALLFGGPAGYALGDLLQQLPADWRPDVLIWWGFHYALPADIADCPVPSLLIVADWHFHVDAVLEYVKAFDHVLCDRLLLQGLQARGCVHASYWPAYGFDPGMMRTVPRSRDLDISFLGNTNPASYAERNRWLRRLARLGDRWRILIRSDVAHPAYSQLLGRSKLVFNHSLRREMNLRAYEAAACGALLLIEEENLEVADFLPPGEACVTYNHENFEAVIAHYLGHEAERERIASRGQELIQAFSYQRQFELLLRQLPALLAGIAARGCKRTGGAFLLEARQLLSTNSPSLRGRAVSLLEALPASELEQDPRLLAALAVCRADYEPLLTQGEAPYPPRTRLQDLAAGLSRALERPLPPAAQLELRHNLAWIGFFLQDWDLLARTLPPLHALLAEPPKLDPGAMLLPVRFTPLYVLRQRLLQLCGGQPGPLQFPLLRLLRWSALYLQGTLALTRIGPGTPASALLAAAHTFAAACEQAPDLPDTWFELARCCQGLARIPDAIAALEAGIEQGVYFPAAWLLQIQLLLQTGQTDAALARRAEALVLFQEPRFEGFLRALNGLKMS
ncbi:MAG: glycosyltransferase [Candidatus Sericytochromatia bacterium]